MWLYFAVLFFPCLVNAEPLRVVVPLVSKKLESLGSEGGSISFLNLPKEPFKVQPVFGDQRQSAIFYEDVPLNDPSAPIGQAHGKFFPEQLGAIVDGAGDIYLTLQKVSSFAAHGLVDQKWDISLDYPLNPFVSLESISLDEQESLKKAFFSSKDTFSLNNDLGLNYSFFYNVGRSSYLDHSEIREENLRQHGGKISIFSQNNIFWKTGYSAFHRSYPGPFNLLGAHLFSEFGHYVMPKLLLNVRMDLESTEEMSLMTGSLGLKNSKFGGLLRLNQEGFYPKIYGQVDFSGSYEKKLQFIFLGEYRPPRLTEVYTDFFHGGKIWKVKSKIYGEGLVAGKARYEIPFHIYKSFFDLKMEYFHNPIGWNYQGLFYENRESFVRPSFSFGISFRDYKTLWEGTFQRYIHVSSANVFQFLDLPKRTLKLKFETIYDGWGLQIQNILYLDIDRYKKWSTLPLPGYSFDFSFEINKTLGDFALKPFFQFILTRRDANASVREGSLWWMGIRF